jgi:hypothetical protein
MHHAPAAHRSSDPLVIAWTSAVLWLAGRQQVRLLSFPHYFVQYAHLPVQAHPTNHHVNWSARSGGRISTDPNKYCLRAARAFASGKHERESGLGQRFTTFPDD